VTGQRHPNGHRRRARQPLLDRAWPWALRFAGLGIGIWETVFTSFDRPSLLMFALALLGFDRFVSFDRRRNGGG
jgi:hypothetical protein